MDGLVGWKHAVEATWQYVLVALMVGVGLWRFTQAEIVTARKSDVLDDERRALWQQSEQGAHGTPWGLFRWNVARVSKRWLAMHKFREGRNEYEGRVADWSAFKK